MTRAKALALFRRILRARRTWEGPSEEKTYILSEARSEFRTNRGLTDPEQIRQKLFEGESRLEMALHYKIPYPRLPHKFVRDDGGRYTREEIERFTKWQFKGMEEAYRVMQRPPAQRSLVGRWDWHLWMFIVTTCIPCFGLYCLAMWARARYWEKERQREREREEAAALEQEPGVEIAALRRELAKVKLLLVFGGSASPALTPKTLKWVLAEEPPLPAPTKEAPTKEPLSRGQRTWKAITRWLPFYVEPLPKGSSLPATADFTALMKPDKSRP